MPPKKRIPKRNSTELLQDVKLESPDAKEVLSNLRRSCLLDENIERLWTPENIQLVQNPELENNYKQRKKEFKENGRKGKEVEDKLVFIAETWAGVQKICKFGIRCLENKPDVLGDARYGVHLCRHFDVLLRHMAFSNLSQFRYVIIFKAMFGRTKAVAARLNEEQEAIEPLPNCDSHISSVKPDMQMEIPDAIGHNYIYLYEYDEDTSYPVQFPRHVLPYAVIQLSRTKDSIEVPLKWGGGTKKVMKKKNGSFQTTHRKTWNSRAAAICAEVSGETLKENISLVEDTKTTVKTDTDSNTFHDIKPCKIELFRSDMDIDERIKIPTNFEFDTCSGTKLIATKTGFVKDPRRSFGNSDGKADSFEGNHDVVNGQTSDLNETQALQHIKQEPVGFDTEEESYTNSLNEMSCNSFDIKQEKVDDYSYPFDNVENNLNHTDETPHSKNLDKIASNKEVIMKRLQQVEREIHWKKQKIDELQKKSSRNIKKEKDNESEIQHQANIIPETHSQHAEESELETSQICLLQNETNRSLSMNTLIREQQSDGDTEGDSTPTLDEPRERQLKDMENIDQINGVVCSSNGNESTPVKSQLGNRENLFDAYRSNMFHADNKKLNQPVNASVSTATSLYPMSQPKALSTASLSELPPLPPLISFAELDTSSFPSTTSKQTEQICGIFPTMKPPITKPVQPKQSPLDILKNEKKCSPFLAKYLTKRLSIGSVDDVKNEAFSSSASPAIGLNGDIQESSAAFDNREKCEQIDEMPQLSPVTTQCDTSNSFDLKSTISNIKTIMETGEIPQSPKIEKATTVTSVNSPNIRDPRLVRLKDDLPTSEKTPDSSSSSAASSDNEMGKDFVENKNSFSNCTTSTNTSKISSAICNNASNTSKSSSENCTNTSETPSKNVKMNWLPGVLIGNNSETKQEEQKKNSENSEISQKDKVMENMKGSMEEMDIEDKQQVQKHIKVEIEDKEYTQKPIKIEQELGKETGGQKVQEQSLNIGEEKKKRTHMESGIGKKPKQHKEKHSQSSTALVDNKSKSSKSDLPQDVRDEMQKTLIKLGDAIKLIQSQCSSDEDSPSKTKSTTDDKSVNLSSDSDYDNAVRTVSFKSVKGAEHHTIESDSDRADRVLNDVFRSEAVTSSEHHHHHHHHHMSTSVTNVHQIQTISTTNIEIKTTQYAKNTSDSYSETVSDAYLNGFDATAYSDAPTTDGETEVGHRIPVKLSGMGNRRPYSKWIETQRNKALERQKRLYKSRLARRFGFDRLKRTADLGKKIDSKRQLALKSSTKRRARSRSRSKEKSSSRSQRTSRTRSKSYRSHSPDVKRKQFPMPPSTEQKVGKGLRPSKSELDRRVSTRGLKREKSPVRDRLYLTFSERGAILRKLRRGIKLTYLENYKLRVYQYKFVRPKTFQYENRERKTEYNKSLASKSPNKSRSDERTFDTRSSNHNDNGSSGIQSRSYRYHDNKTPYSRHSSERQPDFTGARKERTYSPYKRPRRDFNAERNSRGSFKSNYSEKDISDLDVREQNYVQNISRSLESRNRVAEQYIHSEQPVHERYDERNTERTLSKAMTSLLSKIIKGDSDQNVDNTTEGQMANVIYELMKQKVQNETKNPLPQAHGPPIHDYPTSSVDRQHRRHNYRQGDNEVFPPKGQNISHRPHYQPDDRRNHRSSRDSHPYNGGIRSSGSHSYRGNDDDSRSREYTPRYPSNKRSPFNGGRGFPNRLSSRGRFVTRYNRDRYQSSDYEKDQKKFRHGSVSSSSSSTSRHDRSKDSNSRSYSDEYFDNPYLN